jgi:SAM-dependent methyltransferase
MNTKIYNRLQDIFKESPHVLRNPNALSQAISGVFGVQITFSGEAFNIYSLVDQIDSEVLKNYFTTTWQPKTKQYKYSGLSLIDEINDLKPRSVLDLGCGYNEFKGKINNLIGIDPYNNKADHNCHILQFQPPENYDVVISLGSINFGTTDKIFAEIQHAVNLTNNGGLLFFRVNPGEQHEAPEATWIQFYDWDYPFIINTAELLGCDVIALRQDSGNRIYFVLKKR